MKALDEIGYDGWAMAEQPGADSPAGLRKLSEQMDRILPARRGRIRRILLTFIRVQRDRPKPPVPQILPFGA